MTENIKSMQKFYLLRIKCMLLGPSTYLRAEGAIGNRILHGEESGIPADLIIRAITLLGDSGRSGVIWSLKNLLADANSAIRGVAERYLTNDQIIDGYYKALKKAPHIAVERLQTLYDDRAQFIQLLSSGHRDINEEVEKYLSYDEKVEGYIEALKLGGEYGRFAASALGSLGDRKAVETLIAFLTYGEREYGEALGKLVNKSDLPKLHEALSLKDDNVDKGVVYVLGKWGGEEAARKLIELSLDKTRSPFLIIDIVEALGKIEDPMIVPRLIELTSHKIDTVRRLAVEGLNNLEDGRAVEPLIHRLERETSGPVMGAIVDALGRLGDKKSAGILVRTLDQYLFDDSGPLDYGEVRISYEGFRERIIRALQQLNATHRMSDRAKAVYPNCETGG